MCDDGGERSRGSAAPRVTVRQDVCEQADVAHGASARRAGFERVPLRPVQRPQFPVLLSLFVSFWQCRKRHCQNGKAAADVTPAGAFLDFPPAWRLRQPTHSVIQFGTASAFIHSIEWDRV